MSFSMTSWLEQQAEVRERCGLVRKPTVRGPLGAPGKEGRQGKEGGHRRMIDLASNDYLGLSTDPRLAEAATEAIDET